MNLRLGIGFMLFLAIVGCSTDYKFAHSVQKYRAEKISYNHPEWDASTVRKVSERRVEVGMTPDMVVAALGKPDAIIKNGEEEWGYALSTERGMGDIEKDFVYFVYFKRGAVSRTAGDRSKLTHLMWYQ
jgi:outer membrane protein assembly factor BamE (lipoprotein component of BamABCDE complex)